ncbi:hypothetical protein [Luteolibacter soli]|uniref:PepSY domain-containing protein n=1 Tax=Luteolibacter soli TaxID=3135280 RepID=A0ABU9B2X2_9BACT
MPPRPVYHWKSFWIGSLMVAFLAWAWRDSMYFSSHLKWGEFDAGNGAGGLYVWRHGSAPRSGSRPPPEWTRSEWPDDFRKSIAPSAFVAPLICRGRDLSLEDLDPNVAEPPALRDKLEFMIRYGHRDYWAIFLPHWLVLLVIAAPWSGFLVWRVLKQRRHTESNQSH